jgi:hypothetical protein
VTDNIFQRSKYRPLAWSDISDGQKREYKLTDHFSGKNLVTSRQQLWQEFLQAKHYYIFDDWDDDSKPTEWRPHIPPGQLKEEYERSETHSVFTRMYGGDTCEYEETLESNWSGPIPKFTETEREHLNVALKKRFQKLQKVKDVQKYEAIYEAIFKDQLSPIHLAYANQDQLFEKQVDRFSDLLSLYPKSRKVGEKR